MLIAVGVVWFVISLMRLQLKSAFDIRYRVGLYLPCRLFSATTTNLLDCPHVAFLNAVFLYHKEVATCRFGCHGGICNGPACNGPAVTFPLAA